MHLHVSYYPIDQNVGNNNGQSITVDAGNEFTSLYSLLPNMEYHISVIAYTRVGPGAIASLSVTTSTMTDNDRST